MDFWINQSFNAVSYAGLLFLLGGGMTLIFGVMKIVNIAHGGFYLIGGYLGYYIASTTGNFYLGLVGGSVGCAMAGMVFERWLLRELSGQMLRQMLMTMGITLLIQDIIVIISGGYSYTLEPPEWCNNVLEIGGYYFYMLRVFMIGAAVVVYILLWYVMEKTKVGAMIRATVDNKAVAQTLGINVQLVSMGVFCLGAFLAAFAGVIGSAFTEISAGMDFEVLPLAFVVVILGGMGSLKGAAVGALIVGFIDNFARAMFPELAYFSLFFPMVVILSIKPTGLFGREWL